MSGKRKNFKWKLVNRKRNIKNEKWNVKIKKTRKMENEK
jgi:hypothetical protein